MLQKSNRKKKKYKDKERRPPCFDFVRSDLWFPWPGLVNTQPGLFLFQRILAKLIWFEKFLLLKQDQKEEGLFPFLLYKIIVSFHFVLFFLAYLFTWLPFWNKKMKPYTMHFYVMISAILVSRLYQHSSSKRKDRTCYLVIYI